MPSQSSRFSAGCTIPPVVSEGYQAKGDYITIDGLKTCKSIPFRSTAPYASGILAFSPEIHPRIDCFS